MRPSVCEICLGVIAEMGKDFWVHTNLVMDDHTAIPFMHAGIPVGWDENVNRQFLDALDALEEKDDGTK